MNEHAATPFGPHVNHLAPSAKATAARAKIRETVVLARSFLLHRLGCPFLGLCPRSVAHRHLLPIRQEEDTAVRDPLKILLLPLLLLPLLKQHLSLELVGVVVLLRIRRISSVHFHHLISLLP